MTSHPHTPITSLLRRNRLFLDGGTENISLIIC